MYSLNCGSYHETFDTIQELLDDIVTNGMDPNYEITKHGLGIGKTAAELILAQA